MLRRKFTFATNETLIGGIGVIRTVLLFDFGVNNNVELVSTYAKYINQKFKVRTIKERQQIEITLVILRRATINST